MLQPKRTKYRKQFKGRNTGLAQRGATVAFGEKPLGILNLTGPAWRELTEDELGLLATIAYQIGIAIERARLAEDFLSNRCRIGAGLHYVSRLFAFAQSDT